MGRISILVLVCLVALAGCEVPTPPPEIPTPTVGSQNPESKLPPAPVRPTPERGLTPLPVGPGTIYFVRGERLRRVAPDGSGARQLSDLTVTGPPSPSPDGTQVAFLSGRDLYVVAAPGSAARKVATGDMAEPQRLGWSTDGTLVGYVTYDLATVGQEQAWAAPVAGGEPLLIATVAHGALGRGAVYERSVLWSPDNKWVTVSSANNPFRLLRWPLSTRREGDSRNVPGGEIDWSPDGRAILYTEALNGALGIYIPLDNEEGEPFRNEQALVGTGLGEYAHGPRPRWSPASAGADSDLLAYCSRTPEGEPQVGIRRRGGLELPPLAPLTNNPQWSPTGTRVVFETGSLQDDTLGKRWIPTGLSIADIADTGDHKVILLVQEAKWPAWGR